MILDPQDFPLIVEENRIYTQRNPAEQILIAIDAEMAHDIARRLNIAAGLAPICTYDMRSEADVARLIRDTAP